METRNGNQFMPVQAHWIAKTNLFRQNEWYCSNCGFQSEETLRQCPECDAKMEETGFDFEWFEEIESSDTLYAD